MLWIGSGERMRVDSSVAFCGEILGSRMLGLKNPIFQLTKTPPRDANALQTLPPTQNDPHDIDIDTLPAPEDLLDRPLPARRLFLRLRRRRRGLRQSLGRAPPSFFVHLGDGVVVDADGRPRVANSFR